MSIDHATALGTAEVAGVVRAIDLALLRGVCVLGDHVLIHSGMALELMPADQAREAERVFMPAPTSGPLNG